MIRVVEKIQKTRVLLDRKNDYPTLLISFTMLEKACEKAEERLERFIEHNKNKIRL